MTAPDAVSRSQPTPRPARTAYARYAAPLALLLPAALWLWVYARFARNLYFVFDDFIEAQAYLAVSLPQAVEQSFLGPLYWSGYRPVTNALRAILAHGLGLERPAGFFLVNFLLHFANTLLVYWFARRAWGAVRWAYVAAAIFLLFPGHNEGVLWWVGNAGAVAALFALLALVGVTYAPGRGLAVEAGVWLAFLPAALASENLLPLPALLFALDWAQRAPGERRGMVRLYAGLGVAAGVALALRYNAMAGSLVGERADYGLSLAPGHLLRGYAVIGGQLALLHTSAFIHQVLFLNLRDWMSPLNPRALASVLLAVAGSAALLFATRHEQARAPARGARPGWAFWMAWGAAWIVLLALPFAALVGRNPETRYLYAPSVGWAVLLTAAAAWVYDRLRARPAPAARWLAGLWLAAPVALLGFYAYVDTSDVSEWERASGHTRAYIAGVRAASAALPEGADVAEVGVPGNVGSAYTFVTQRALASGLHLLAGVQGDVLHDDVELGVRLNAPQGKPPPVILAYDAERAAVVLADQALLCNPELTCTYLPVAQAPGTPTESAAGNVYVQVYDGANPAAGGLSLLLGVGSSAQPEVRSCRHFYDLNRVVADPTQIVDAEIRARCAATAEELARRGIIGEQ